MRGGKGNDRFVDNTGNDVFRGGEGMDVVDFSIRDNSVWLDLSTAVVSSAGAGNNAFFSIEGAFGGGGHDRFTGSDLGNRFKGNGGDDWLRGGGDADQLDGGSGNDRLSGGRGNATLAGGSGKDKFVFRDKDNSDIIEDFRDNVDTILLDGNLWSGTKSVSRILTQFGAEQGADYVLDFGGGDVLTILDTTKTQLLDDIVIIWAWGPLIPGPMKTKRSRR